MGSAFTTAAERTPGIASTRSTRRSKKARIDSLLSYLTGESSSRAVSRPSGSNPGSTPRIRSKLRIRSPAATTSTSASAIWVTTRPRRKRCRRAPALPPLPPSVSARERSGRAAYHAGTRPKSRPVDDADHGRERQHREVEADRVEPRQGRWRGRHERPRPVRREQEAGRAADHGDRRALGEELAHDPPGAGAERRAHRDLPVALLRASQEERRHVGRGDQQEEDDRAQEHEQHRADVADQLFRGGRDRAGKGLVVLIGILADHRSHEDTDFPLRRSRGPDPGAAGR